MIKATIIEVKNGWLVEKSTPPFNYAVATSREDTYVFRDIKELQDKLPEILGVKPKDNPMYEAFQPKCATCGGVGYVQSNLAPSHLCKCNICDGTGRYSEPIPEGPKNL